MSRERKRLIFVLVLATLALAIGANFAVPEVRLRLRIKLLAEQLRSEDVKTRVAAVTQLFAIGRPEIDDVYPEAVAEEALLARTLRSVVVLVHRTRTRRSREDRGDDLAIESVLFQPTGDTPMTPATSMTMPESVWGASLNRALVVLQSGLEHGTDMDWPFQSSPGRADITLSEFSSTNTAVRLVVPLDDALGPAVVDEVTRALAR